MTEQKLLLDEVRELAEAALLKVGTAPIAARSLATAVMAAERDGIRSHGLIYIPIYCEHVMCGKVDGQAMPVQQHQTGGAIVVDAGTGFAHPAIDLGFEALIPAAHQQGCACLVIRNSYNCGVLGYHVERLAEAGLVAFGFTNAPASIAPHGGHKAVIGTNPLAFAVPGPDGPAFVIDQSASVVARSEVMTRAREGRALPLGWALDEAGEPTTDAEQAMRGTMVPSGGYKGFSAGLLVEVMAAALSGAMLGRHASAFSGTVGGPPRTGQCFVALSPVPFSDGMFDQRIHDLVLAITEQEVARLPGARRRKHRQQAEKSGVKIDSALVDRVRAITGSS
ncbi:MAG TPA: Ldh family oxidoreductase [Gammaproteobacteria bacterium]|jgi:(2R)-3-sulfolactate dehydrogenase (NADP+)|nr:Ldh family oxidoreductase [Gammaproteobacteria bacterium]HIN59229.1 Ldh family oxidoreductase [Gammaproteobacteria bacterium]